MGIKVMEVDTTHLRLGKGVPRLVLKYFNGQQKMEVEFQKPRTISAINEWIRETMAPVD